MPTAEALAYTDLVHRLADGQARGAVYAMLFRDPARAPTNYTGDFAKSPAECAQKALVHSGLQPFHLIAAIAGLPPRKLRAVASLWMKGGGKLWPQTLPGGFHTEADARKLCGPTMATSMVGPRRR